MAPLPQGAVPARPLPNPNPVNTSALPMNKLIIRPSASTKSKTKAKTLYYVRGKGFTAKTEKGATRFPSYDHAEEEIDTLSRTLAMGAKIIDDPKAPRPAAEDPNIVQNADGKSFAVGFIGTKDRAQDGTIRPHKQGLSPRRFRTRAEAVQHGARFVQIEPKHTGFHVSETYDRVNAYINAATGKTNPEIGKKRTNRDASGVMALDARKVG